MYYSYEFGNNLANELKIDNNRLREQITNMLIEEANAELRDHAHWYYRKRHKFQLALITAFDRALWWVKACHEYDTSDMLNFIGSHRHAAAYFILLGKKLHPEKDGQY